MCIQLLKSEKNYSLQIKIKRANKHQNLICIIIPSHSIDKYYQKCPEENLPPGLSSNSMNNIKAAIQSYSSYLLVSD